MSSVRAATYAAYRVPNCHAGRSPRAAGPPFHVGRGSLGQSALPPPKGWLAHTPHSSHRADSPRVYLAALALPYHRPCRMIAGPGQTHPATMGREPLPQTRCLRRSLDPAVGRLPEDEGIASPRNCRNSSKAAMARRVMNTASTSPA